MYKNMMLSLCAGVLCFCMLFSTPVSAGGYTDIESSAYASSIRLLSALGVLTGQDELTFAPDRNVTRAEFAAMLCRLYPRIEINAASTVFADVPADYWAANEIGTINRLQIMNGTDNGMFLPEQNITLNEAAKTMVVMAGYDQLASIKGGYPTGYFLVANNKKILRGVNGLGDMPVTRAVAAKLLNNMLQIPALEVNKFGMDITYQESSLHTNFYTFLGIEKGTGIVEATEITSLSTPNRGRKNTVMINGVLYNVGETDAAQYLGMTVDFYYQYDEMDLQELRFVQISDVKNTSLTLEADSIISYSDRVYSYEGDDDGDVTEARLADDFRLIYNGRACADDFNADYMKPLDGTVRLVDYNGDGRYDVVFVEDYETIVVGGIDTDNKTIYDINDPTKKIVLNDNASLLTVVLKDAEGNPFPLEKLAKNNVVSVIKNGDYASLVVSQKQVSGTLEQFGKDEGTTWYQIGGTIYEPTNELITSGLPEARAGDNLTLYLNHNDKIARIAIDTGAGEIGFLAQKSMENTRADSGIYLRIFTADGEMKDFQARKIRWNGSSGKLDATELYNKIPTYTLVEYSVNTEGEITALSIPDAMEQAADGQLFLRSKGNYHVYKSRAKTFGGKENLMGDCVIFSVPSEQNVTEKDEYQILTPADLVDGTYYSYDAYGTSKERVTAQYILMVGQGDAQITGDTGFSIVTRVTQTIDEEGINTYKLTLLSSSGESSVIVKDPKLVSHNSTTVLGKNISIDEGDIVRCAINNRGQVIEIELAYDLETNTYIDRSDSARYDTKLRTMFGYVGEIEDTVFQLLRIPEDANGKPDANASPELIELCTTDGARIYVYDSEKPKGKVRTGTYTDLLSYRQAGAKCSKVFIHLRAAVPQTIVVYK